LSAVDVVKVNSLRDQTIPIISSKPHRVSLLHHRRDAAVWRVGDTLDLRGLLGLAVLLWVGWLVLALMQALQRITGWIIREILYGPPHSGELEFSDLRGRLTTFRAAAGDGIDTDEPRKSRRTDETA
jgi:hypothetical protein